MAHLSHQYFTLHHATSVQGTTLKVSQRIYKPGDGEECCEMLSSAHAIALTTTKLQ